MSVLKATEHSNNNANEITESKGGFSGRRRNP
jgi:hypothetical protein